MKTFPVLADHRLRQKRPNLPRAVPWSFIAPHARRAYFNHHQTLEELAARGGLDPLELMLITRDQSWRGVKLSDALILEACEWLEKEAAEFEEEPP